MPREKVFIPFVGSTYFREGSVIDNYSRDQYFENVVIEKVENALSGQKQYFISPRENFTRIVAPAWAAGPATTTSKTTRCLEWTSALTNTNKYVAAGSSGLNTIQLAIEGLACYTATSSNNYTYPRYLLETLSGTIPALLVGTCQQLDPKCEWFYHIEGTPGLTKISDAQFPTDNIGEMVYLNGYHFIMAKDGKIYNSDLNSISSWPGDFIGTDVEPDNGAGLALFGEVLVAFSTRSLELFKISNNPTGSPLEKIEQASIRHGALPAQGSPYRGLTIIKGADGIYFISTPNAGNKVGIGIYKYDGKISKISSPDLDKLLMGSLTANVYDAALNGIFYYKGSNYLVGHVLLDSSLLKGFFINLDLNNQMSMIVPANLGTGDPFSCIWSNAQGRILTGNGPTPDGTYLMGLDALTGASIQDVSFAGSSVTYTATIQTGNVDFGTSRYKTFHQLRLVGEDPLGGATSNWSVSWSDNDGASYSTARTINQASLNQWISGLGASRRRRFKFTQAIDGTNTASRLEGFELEYTVHGQ